VARILKSKTYAVVVEGSTQFSITYICLCVIEGVESLEVNTLTIDENYTTKDAIINILIHAGLSVRFFDVEEKMWMVCDTENGPSGVSGNRDGSWGPPNTVEEFKKDFLKHS
jgi:hypothetical protein